MKKVVVLLFGLLLVSGVYAAGNEMTFGCLLYTSDAADE